MTEFLSIWSGVGPLIGVMVGGYLTSRMQKKHWVLDNKKEEYRELLSALMAAVSNVVTLGSSIVQSPTEQFACDESKTRAGTVILDRLFIAREVRQMNLPDRWIRARRDLDAQGDLQLFAQRCANMMNDITNSALKTIE